MEPLIDLSMANHRPCVVPHKGGTRTHIALQEFGEGVSAAAGRWSATLKASMSLSRSSTKRLEAGGGASAEGPPVGPRSSAGTAPPSPSAGPPQGQSSMPPPPPASEQGGLSEGESDVDMGTPSGETQQGGPGGPTLVHRLTDGYSNVLHPRQQHGRLDFALQVG